MNEQRSLGAAGMVSAIVAIVAGGAHPSGYVRADGDAFYVELADVASGGRWVAVHVALFIATAVLVAVLVELVRRSDSLWGWLARPLCVLGGGLALLAIGLEVGLSSLPDNFFAVADVEGAVFGMSLCLFWGLAFLVAGWVLAPGGAARWVPVGSGLLGLVSGPLIASSGLDPLGFGLFSTVFVVDVLWVFWMSLRQWRESA